MVLSQAAPGSSDHDVSLGRLWLVTLGPPVIWGVRFAVVYVLVPYACRADAIALLHVITLIALAAVAGLGWMAWSSRGGARGERARFMALFGILSSGLFLVVIAAEGLANVMVDPCLAPGPLIP